jgi:hypothetical protein
MRSGLDLNQVAAAAEAAKMTSRGTTDILAERMAGPLRFDLSQNGRRSAAAGSSSQPLSRELLR